MDNIKEYITKLPYWGSLDSKQREYVMQNSSVKFYEKGSIIHGCSDTCLGMIYVINGGIRVYLLSPEGREITLFRIEKDEPCVLSASCVISQITFETQMVAEKDCYLLVVNSGAYKRLTEENIYVKCFTYELMSERFSGVMWTMQQILFAKMDERLASFLLSEYEKTGQAEIRMTHEMIAQHINSAREVVARMLKRFASDGLVELKRGSIIIKDIEEMKNI